MSWPLLVGVVLGLGIALFATLSRRAALRRMRRAVQERDRAVRQGSGKAQLQHPVVDLTRCLGCGKCVDVCPEDGVLDLVHGQAQVVNGARCMGIAACERECPVGAITVTLADVSERTDIPAVEESLEAVGAPGLFLAGEVTAHALIKTAIEHGTAVAAEVARRTRETPAAGPEILDLCVVGAGPAGLACSLEAARQGLRFVTLDQGAGPGGTVAKYPRQKLVMTLPVELPLHGRLKNTTYTKEQLIGIWKGIAERHRLPIRYGEECKSIERAADGSLVVRTGGGGVFAARHVCLAVGRRGTPRRLGVPGEELSKVAYGLLDAHSYRGRKVLVVGGGDSAVEVALALAEQPGNEVTLSYRKESFFRLRSKNQQRLEAEVGRGRLGVLFRSEVKAILPDAVELDVGNGHGTRTGRIPNDEVFVLAGGVPPQSLLEGAGVSFDPALRPPSDPVTEQGSGLVRGLIAGFLLSLAALVWALWHADYYTLPESARPTHDSHGLLDPARGAGLWFGIAAASLIVVNLCYLLRRSPRVRFNLGSLQLWMSSHVATGILALLCALLHGAMRPHDTPGGHAFWALAILLVTGAIGRYFYAYVPRAANGRELELAEVKARLVHLSAEWDQGQRFGEQARAAVEALTEKRQWKSSFLGRVVALFDGQRDLRHLLAKLEAEGRAQGVAEDHLAETLSLARRAHRTALMAAHFEDLRAVLGAWRYLHRWIAAALVVLVGIHIVHALLYGALFLDGGPR